MKDLYTAHVHVEGGRDGHARASDGKLDLDLALPREIGGSGAGSNSEQLFAAGFAACFASSIKFTAQQKGLNAGRVEVDADVVLGVHDDGRYGLKARLDVKVPGLSGEALETVIAEAKRICAYTNATAGNVETTYVVRGQ